MVYVGIIDVIFDNDWKTTKMSRSNFKFSRTDVIFGAKIQIAPFEIFLKLSCKFLSYAYCLGRRKMELGMHGKALGNGWNEEFKTLLRCLLINVSWGRTKRVVVKVLYVFCCSKSAKAMLKAFKSPLVPSIHLWKPMSLHLFEV